MVAPSAQPATIAIEESLVILGMKAKMAEEVLVILGERLLHAGYVHKDFTQAVLDRERSSPTGLPTEIPVAIPHTDVSHCKRPAIAVAVLDEPVPFGLMGAPGEQAPVQAVFMLALTEPHTQVRWLNRLINFFQQTSQFRQLLAANTPECVASILRAHLISPGAGSTEDGEV